MLGFSEAFVHTALFKIFSQTLQNQSPAGRDVLIRKLPPIPLISIADVKYYNQDFKPGSSFL